jgi:hypothetical protein
MHEQDGYEVPGIFGIITPSTSGGALMSYSKTKYAEFTDNISAAWLSYLSSLRTNSQDLNRLSHVLSSSIDNDDALFSSSDDDGPNMKKAHETATFVIRNLVRHAAHAFTAPGCAPIAIDPEKWVEKYLHRVSFHSDWEEYEAFSAKAVWAALEDQYGGDKGATVTFSAAARGIVSKFGLHREQETKTRPGCHVLNARVWADDFDRKNYNKTVLSYTSRDEIEKLYTNLATFARWAGEEKQGGQIDEAKSAMSLSRGKFESRERVMLCDSIQVVCYLSRFEYLIRDAMADKLKVFVSTYASDMFAEAE